MARYIFDIETFPMNPDDVQDFAGKYKPYPTREQIYCISLVNVDEKDNQPITFSNVIGEKDMLDRFWSYLGVDDELIGFNSSSYDFPYLLIRSLANNVMTYYPSLTHTDLRIILTNNNPFLRGTLSDYALLLGETILTENGSHVYNLLNEGKSGEVVKHCEEDVMLTKKLFIRMQECNLI